MSTQKVLNVRAKWDEEARVWVAESDDVPGLITEAESIEALTEKLKILIPELLAANDVILDPDVESVPLNLIAQRDSILNLRH